MLKIAIDAGHYLHTSGKRCLKSIDPKETREWTLNARIADKLQDLLSNYECDVLRVDDVTGNFDVELSKRCIKANQWKADLYISIHHNAGINGGSGGGTVVFYYSENKERKAQAQSLYDEVVKQTGLRGNRATKVKKYEYYVLKNTEMAAFLLENGFMDSRIDTPIILTEEHADKTAVGLLNFLIKSYGLTKKPDAPEEDGVIYKVQCGAFSKKKNAENLKKELEAAGFDAYIVKS